MEGERRAARQMPEEAGLFQGHPAPAPAEPQCESEL